MGHHDNAHGRVFRGLKKDSRKMVPFTKRSEDYSDNVHQFIHRRQASSPSHNTNGDRIVMHVPEGFPEKAQSNSNNAAGNLAQKAQADDVETVYEQVFKTLDQTFDGPPQFFSTQEVQHTSTQPAVQATPTAGNSRQQNNDDDDQTPSRQPSAQVAATSSASSAKSAVNTSSAAPRATSSAEKDDASSTHSAIHVTSSSIVTGDVDNTTRGAQLAEKTSSMVVGTPISVSQSAVPEVEQTGLTSGAKAGLAVGIIFGLGLVFGLIFFCWRRKKNQRELEEHNEKSAASAPVQVNRFSSDSNRLQRTSTQTSATAPRLSLRPVTQFLPNLTAGSAEQKNAQNPFGDAAALSEKSGHDRANSVNSDSTSSIASTGAPVAAGTAQVVNAAAAPIATGPNNVHRVQLEFKPSMEDELELKSGQLVRMLHEYDDGWALCAKMDRSAKGVVPRTCLSKMPVKPRGPPSQTGFSAAGPNNMPTPPPGGANVPRPLTPTQQGRQRAPTLDSVPARKPVPGQAL